jgi:hypothetical protein
MTNARSAKPIMPPPIPPTMAPVRVAVTGVTDDEALVVDEVNEGARDTVTMAVVSWVVRGVVDVVCSKN